MIRSIRALACVILMSAVVLAQSTAPALAYTVTGDWGTGFQAALVVTNNGTAAVANWHLQFDFTHNLTSVWDAVVVSHAGNTWTIGAPSWDPNLAPGASHSFGWVAQTNGPMVDPVNCTLNGVPCAVNGVITGGGCGGTSNFSIPPAGGFAPGSKRVVGYFTSWSVYGRNYHVPMIPAAQLSHVNYAFANISSGGAIQLGDSYADVDRFYPGDSWATGALRGSFHQLQILKAAYPQLRTLISVGGWTWSGSFSTVAATAASRQAFAQSCVQFVVQYGFDGVDLDWEYPVSGGLPGNAASPADPANYTLLLAAMRAALNAQSAIDGHTYLLTIAAPAGPANMANFQLAQMHPYVDWMNVMAYDFHGGWESTTGFNSPLYAAPGDPGPAQFNTHAAVQAYLAAGVPAAKIVVGSAVFDYKDLAAHYVTAATRHWQAQAQTPWLYDPATGVMISYDDPQSIGLRAQYVNSQNLGGAMLWELSCDDLQHSLLTALQAPLMTQELWLQAATTGGGMGDFYLRAGGAPPGSTHVIIAASATPAAAGPGTGPLAGLVPDPLFWSFLGIPPSPPGPTHYALASDPYVNGPLILPPCTAPGFAGQHWEMRAGSYDAATGTVTSLSNVVSLGW
jgi:chitinase